MDIRHKTRRYYSTEKRAAIVLEELKSEISNKSCVGKEGLSVILIIVGAKTQ